MFGPKNVGYVMIKTENHLKTTLAMCEKRKHLLFGVVTDWWSLKERRRMRRWRTSWIDKNSFLTSEQTRPDRHFTTVFSSSSSSSLFSSSSTPHFPPPHPHPHPPPPLPLHRPLGSGAKDKWLSVNTLHLF